MSAHPLITFMIATRNRVGDLVQTLESCLAHDWPCKEILVVDDASTDGTHETVRSKFPQVAIFRNEVNRGSVASRNEILRRAKGEYIICLDDDSRFIHADACRRVVARMEAEPDLGILAFQAIGPEFPERMTEAGRLQGEFHCCSFAACGAAIRRSALARLDPLPEYFFHMYEESDLALRVWNAGYRVLQWNEIIVYHAFDPRCRNELRNHFLHARNEACSVIMRYPWALLLPGLMTRLLTQFRYAWRRGWWWKEPVVWLAIAARLPVALAHRRPVTARTVRISLGVNRVRTEDPRTAWALGDQSWWNIVMKQPCNSASNG